MGFGLFFSNLYIKKVSVSALLNLIPLVLPQKALEFYHVEVFTGVVLIGEKNVFVEEKRGSRGEPGRGGFRRNEPERFRNEHEHSPRRNYFNGPNGNGRGGGMGRGHGRGFSNNNNVVLDEKEGSAGNGYTNGNGTVGQEQSGNNLVRSYGNDRRPFQSGNRNYGGERRGGYGGNGYHVYRER